MTHTIREYREKALNAVISSWENASKLAHPFLTQEFLAQERDNIPNVYLPNADTWVAEINGRVIGFIALLGNEVGAIFVEPTFQGKGVGTSLMDKARELHGELEVEVFQANSFARKFYANYGFQPLMEKIHAETGNKVLRLKFSPNKILPQNPALGK
ncbi:MAG: GNAT family N-acetyltransferase [Moorea sp. SIO2B7]|nr:GNAT family N-acetyltransferase [Moorena sp. SIO2B7]